MNSDAMAQQAHRLVRELYPLKAIFPGKADPNWLSRTARIIWDLEMEGRTHFGGPDVFAWWLVQRCIPKAPMSKATIRKIQVMCGGSQKCLDLLVAMTEERSRPKRLKAGWTFDELVGYLSLVKAERS